MCDKSRNTWLCVHWQWNTLEWCQRNALQASPVVHLVTPLSCVSLSMNTQPSVPAISVGLYYMFLPWHYHSASMSVGLYYMFLPWHYHSASMSVGLYYMFLPLHYHSTSTSVGLYYIFLPWHYHSASMSVGLYYMKLRDLVSLLQNVSLLFAPSCHTDNSLQNPGSNDTAILSVWIALTSQLLTIQCGWAAWVTKIWGPFY